MISGAQALAEHYFMQGQQSGQEKTWDPLAVHLIQDDLPKQDIIQALVSAGMYSKEAVQLYDRLLSSNKGE